MPGGIDSDKLMGQKTGEGIKVPQACHSEWGFEINRATDPSEIKHVKSVNFGIKKRENTRFRGSRSLIVL